MKSVVGPRLQESWNRFTRLSGLNSRLGFLLDTKYLLCNESVNNKSLDEECISLSRFYCSDLYSIELYDESCDCSMLARSGVNTILHTALELLTFIAESSPESLQQGTLRLCRGVHVFFFQTIALLCKLFWQSVSVASCERSFTKLKFVLTHLRSSIGQDRLDG